MGINWPTVMRDKKEFMRFVGQQRSVVLKKKKNKKEEEKKKKKKCRVFQT